MKPLRKRLMPGVLAVALATGVSLASTPSRANATSAIFPPCDGFWDCVYSKRVLFPSVK